MALETNLVAAGGREQSRESVEERPQVQVAAATAARGRGEVGLDEEVDVVAADGRVGVPRHEAPLGAIV